MPLNFVNGLGNESDGRSVLITARFYGAGGIETHILNLSRVLVENGAEVTIVARFARPEALIIKLHREIPVRLITTPFAGDLKYFRLSTAWAMAVWPRLLHPIKFDTLLSMELSRFTTFLARFVKPGGQVVVGVAGEPLRRPLVGDCQQARRVVTAFVAETPFQAEAVSRIYSGLPVAAIPHLGNYGATVLRSPRLTQRLRVAFPGRYSAAKGVHRLLRLWPSLDIQPAELDFYGSGPDRARLQNDIAALNLGNVRVHGGWLNAADLGKIFGSTDLVVLPSETEGLPLVLLEAMAHGVPFVASDVGAVRTLAEDNPDVRVVPLDDSALKTAIEEMAAEIRAGRVRGERLQQYHRARYSYEALSARWAGMLLHGQDFWRDQQACAAGNQEWTETEAFADRAIITK